MSRVAWGLLVAVWLSPALAQNASPATTTEVSLSVGTSLDSALAALNALGHRIVSATDPAVVHADGHTVLVWVDRSGASVPLPENVRAACDP